MQWWPLDHIKATVAGPRSLFCFVALVLPATSLSLCYQSFRCPRSVNTPTPCKSVKLARYSESTTVVVAEPGEWNYYFIYNYFNFFLKTCGSFHLLVPTWMFNKAQWACRASKYQTLAGSAWRLRLLNVSKLWWKCRVDSNCIRQLLTAVSSFLGFLLKCFGILIVFFVIIFFKWLVFFSKRGGGLWESNMRQDPRVPVVGAGLLDYAVFALHLLQGKCRKYF